MKQLTYLILAFSLITGCAEDSPKTFVEKVEKAHEKSTFMEKGVISFDLKLLFGGKERLNGNMTISSDSRKIKITEKNGAEMYVVDDLVKYKELPESDPEKIRFAAYTWPYFFMLPYKLSDPGTIWSPYENKKMNGKEYEVEKLTFEAGTGDAPDDWYVVYADPTTLRLSVASYIVTYSKSAEEAAADPHAIKYDQYETIDGVPIATKWTFWGWTAEDGLTDQLGEATLSNIQFLEESEVSFEAPSTYQEI